MACFAGVAQLVERNLAKVEVAGSNPVTRLVRIPGIGAWLSPVERCVRDAEVPGSNPGAPTEGLVRDGRPFLHPDRGPLSPALRTLTRAQCLGAKRLDAKSGRPD